jgi:hypothetical protein
VRLNNVWSEASKGPPGALTSSVVPILHVSPRRFDLIASLTLPTFLIPRLVVSSLIVVVVVSLVG